VRIHTFSYEDRETGWRLEDAAFDQLNLLVGVSGVGKTRIIEALRTVTSVAIDRPAPLPLAKWSLRFEHDEVQYEWSAHISLSNTQRGGRAFEVERIVRNRVPLIERTGNELLFDGEPQRKLDLTTSAIDLLSPEEKVEPIGAALELMLFSLLSGEHHHEAHRPFDFPEHWVTPDEIVVERRAHLADQPRLERLSGNDRDAATRSAFVFGLYLMQEVYPAQFNALFERFREVFPSVDALRVVRDRAASRERFSVELKESTDAWIPQSHISAGMLRTLVYLAEFETAPSSSVILIDEFEASLGINCLPAVTDAMLSRDDCQFIVTSHHPYVINHVDAVHWKLIERRGSAVRLIAASTLPALSRASRHESFLRLINLDAYADGIR
jgi:AAA domain, putative AbiEii toxin, Type IV TA system